MIPTQQRQSPAEQAAFCRCDSKPARSLKGNLCGSQVANESLSSSERASEYAKASAEASHEAAAANEAAAAASREAVQIASESLNRTELERSRHDLVEIAGNIEQLMRASQTGMPLPDYHLARNVLRQSLTGWTTSLSECVSLTQSTSQEQTLQRVGMARAEVEQHLRGVEVAIHARNPHLPDPMRDG